jgi:hypothetical protein
LPDVVGDGPPSRNPGVAFVPVVVHNKRHDKYVMWYENFNMTAEFKKCCIDSTKLDCCHGQYSVALSDRADGGFVTERQGPGHAANCTCCNYQGDFTLFVDDDEATGYLVVRHDGFFCIEQLDETFTAGTGLVHHAPMVENKDIPGDEAPILFRRGGTYYLLEATGCCGCKGGSTTYVLTADHPLGPYTLQGNIGEAADGSPVTKAQPRSVFKVPAPGGGEPTIVHLSNNYVPGEGGEGTCTNGGLLYWYPLQFGSDGQLRNLTWRDEVRFEMADEEEAVYRYF